MQHKENVKGLQNSNSKKKIFYLSFNLSRICLLNCNSLSNEC